MNTFDDLQTLWQEAPAPRPPDRLDDLKAEASRLDRTLRWRDLRELGAAAAVALFFSVVAVTWDDVRIAALATVGVSVWIAAVIIGVRLGVPRASPWAPLREAVAAEHRWLRAQTALLRWAWLWYVLPATVSILAFDYANGGFGPVFPYLMAAGAVSLGWMNWKAADELSVTRDAFAAHLRDLSV